MGEQNNWMIFSVLVLVAAFLFSSFGTTGQFVNLKSPYGQPGVMSDQQDRATANLQRAGGFDTQIGIQNSRDPTGNGRECESDDLQIMRDYIAKYSGSDTVKENYWQDIYDQCFLFNGEASRIAGDVVYNNKIKCPDGWSVAPGSSTCRRGTYDYELAGQGSALTGQASLSQMDAWCRRNLGSRYYFNAPRGRCENIAPIPPTGNQEMYG